MLMYNYTSTVCAGKYIEYQELSVAVLKGDHSALESHIDKHITSRDPMASLASRYACTGTWEYSSQQLGQG